jgi:DNA polymerase IV
MSERSVFHIRLPDFEVQVERAVDSSLRSRAIAIISSNHSNGTIVALSPEAHSEGLYRGMAVSLARKMSHSVQLMPCNINLYQQMHHQLYQTIARYSPLTEPAQPGQYFLDMSGMERIYASYDNAALKISRHIASLAALYQQIGISRNKLVSSIASEVIPEPIIRIQPATETHFLAPLPPRILPSANISSVDKVLRFLILKEIKELQSLTEDALVSAELFGAYGKQVKNEAHGEDESRVKAPDQHNNLSEQLVLEKDTNDEILLHAAVSRLAEQIAFQLRQRNEGARILAVEIHYTDGFRRRRQAPMRFNDNASMIRLAVQLFALANDRRNRIRSVLVAAEDLKPLSRQMDIFDRSSLLESRLSASLDKIRRRHGFESIQTGDAFYAASQSRNLPVNQWASG